MRTPDIVSRAPCIGTVPPRPTLRSSVTGALKGAHQLVTTGGGVHEQRGSGLFTTRGGYLVKGSRPWAWMGTADCKCVTFAKDKPG
eukprot:8352173-Pyramimonas_sp.AAC.1